MFATCMLHADSLFEEIAKALPTDKFANEIKEGLNDSSKPKNKEDLDCFRFKGGGCFTKTNTYMFQRAVSQVLQMCHDDPLPSDFRVTKALELISQGYWWPQLWKFIKEFIKTCDTCARSKFVHHGPYELLRLLPIPN